jgi:hypothetical protein
MSMIPVSGSSSAPPETRTCFPSSAFPGPPYLARLRGEFKPAVGTEAVSKTEIELHARLGKLERRIQVLLAVMRLLLALVRVSARRLNGERLPTGKAKADILRAVEAARNTLSLGSAVRVLGLSVSRYHAWKRAERACDLADRSSCPKTFPGQLTTFAPSVAIPEHARYGGVCAASRQLLRDRTQPSLATQRPERTDPGRGVLRASREHPRRPGSCPEGGAGETTRSEPGALMCGMHGVGDVELGPRERSVNWQAKLKTLEEARLSNYRHEKSRMR